MSHIHFRGDLGARFAWKTHLPSQVAWGSGVATSGIDGHEPIPEFGRLQWSFVSTAVVSRGPEKSGPGPRRCPFGRTSDTGCQAR